MISSPPPAASSAALAAPHPHPPPPRVVFLLLPQVNLLDLAGPAQVFHTAVHVGAPYQLRFCAEQPDVMSAQGLALGQVEPLLSVGADDLVIVPGLSLEAYASGEARVSGAVVRWLQQAHAAGAHLASICTGAFVLGEAGLLDGRRCTTHWDATAALHARYPRAHVIEAILFVHDRGVTTSAGIAAGIDLALALVEERHGPLVTAQLARYLVVYLRRSQAHGQESVYLAYRTHLHPGVHRAQDYLIQAQTSSISLREVAAHAQMSVRQLLRAFKEATGISPLQYHQRLRLEIASALLRNQQLSIEAVAQQCGFEDPRHFRRLWKRTFGAPPSLSRTPRSA
jgi:transcriptional regulator GlxA family with amidase domain